MVRGKGTTSSYYEVLQSVFDAKSLQIIKNYLEAYIKASYVFEKSLQPYRKILGNPNSPATYAVLYILYILRSLNAPITTKIVSAIASWLNDLVGKPIISPAENAIGAILGRLRKWAVLDVTDTETPSSYSLPDDIYNILKIGYLQVERELQRRQESYAIAKAMFGFSDDEYPKSELEFARMDEKVRYAFVYWKEHLKRKQETSTLETALPYSIEEELVVLKPYVHSIFEEWMIREIKNYGLDTYRRLLEQMYEKFLKDVYSKAGLSATVSVDRIVTKKLLAIDLSDTMINELPKKYDSVRNTFVIDGVIVSIVQPLKFPLFDVVVCENMHVSLLEPGESEKRTICPKCSSAIIYKGSITVPGVLATLETISSSEFRESFQVFIPMPIWDKLRQDFSSRKQILVAEIPRRVPTGSRKMLKIQFLAFGAKFGKKRVILSEDTLDKIRRIAKLPTWKILRLFSNILFGFIYGEEHAKIAALLTAFSQGKDVIVRETIRTRSKLYGVLYTLMIGSPQSAKSRILETTIRYANPVFYDYALLHAGSISVAGIAASYDPQTGGLKFGIEPLNHGRIVAYDELDKAVHMDEVIAQLNTIMSEYVVKYHKATFRLTVPAVSAKLFAANLPPNIDLASITTTEELINAILRYADEKNRKPLFGKATEPFLSRIDFLVYMPIYMPADKILEYQLQKKEEIELDFEVDRDLFTAYIDLIKEYYGREGSYTRVPKEAEYELMRVLSDLTKIPSEFTRLLNQPRRLDTFFKIARTIAHMHLRSKVIPQDIRDAVAFYLYVHMYPFITYLENVDPQATTAILGYFKEELGDYAVIHVVQQQEIKEATLSSISAPQKIVFRTEEDVAKWVLNTIAKKGLVAKEEIVDELRALLAAGKIEVDKRLSRAKWVRALTSRDPLSIRFLVSEILDKLKYKGVIIEASQGYYTLAV